VRKKKEKEMEKVRRDQPAGAATASSLSYLRPTEYIPKRSFHRRSSPIRPIRPLKWMKRSLTRMPQRRGRGEGRKG
jgi:hypothetical protein